MILIVTIAFLVGLGFATFAGVIALQRVYPPLGKKVQVKGAALHVVELGPQEAVEPPILLLHGASSNLEAMRRPLGELLARQHRVMLIDRPGHGWSERE